jgi:2-polyprenyl-3-methyl-5-hydroxy-6-metoxy-1,4-benzoquinol methylase
MNCRHCHAPLTLSLIDLGTAPPSNAYLTAERLNASESWYPLRVRVCQSCWLVQTEDYADASELFGGDYAYFSGFSHSWLEHSRRYVKAMAERFALGPNSHVVEIAANDGYLLQYVRAAGIPCLGVEPTASTAAVAREKGIPIVESFFGRGLASELAKQDRCADLLVANNVLAHVPNINDFVGGFEILLKPKGVATFEFPHLLNLIRQVQFDTIYHEHFSYLSLLAVNRIFGANGLRIFDVEELPTHGGSLRVFTQRTDSGGQPVSSRVAAILTSERAAGFEATSGYSGFQARADRIKHEFLAFLIDAARAGKTVAGYGAAAKGNTLLNFAGVRPDLLAFVCDANPAKQGKFLPGSRVPILPEQAIRDRRPDYVAILPWNLASEIRDQLAYIGAWGGRFVTAVPELSVINAAQPALKDVGAES